MIALSLFQTAEILAAASIGIILVFASIGTFDPDLCNDQVIDASFYKQPIEPCEGHGRIAYDLQGDCLINELPILAGEPCASDTCQGEIEWKNQPFQTFPPECTLQGILRFIST